MEFGSTQPLWSSDWISVRLVGSNTEGEMTAEPVGVHIQTPGLEVIWWSRDGSQGMTQLYFGKETFPQEISRI